MPGPAAGGRGIFPDAGKDPKRRKPGEDSRMRKKEHSEAEEKPPEQETAKEDADVTSAKPEKVPEPPAPFAPPAADTVETLRKRNEELLNKLVYLQAEFENLQKRTLKEKQEFIVHAREGMLRDMLPFLDDLDKAVEVMGDKDGGLAMLRTKLLKILEQNGLSEIPAKGETFDPFLHDAAEFVNAGDKADGTITEVLRKGYRCNLKVLRPSLVVVVKNEGEKNA